MTLQPEAEEVFVAADILPPSPTPLLVANRAPASRLVYKNFLHTLAPETHCPNNSYTSTVACEVNFQKEQKGVPVFNVYICVLHPSLYVCFQIDASHCEVSVQSLGVVSFYKLGVVANKAIKVSSLKCVFYILLCMLVFKLMLHNV